MKNTIVFFIHLVGFLSTSYLAFIGLIFAVLIAKAITGTATQSGNGEFFNYAITKFWILLVSAFFSSIYIAYIIKHQKNQKRREEEKKFKGSLIGKPY
jgi:uncharacterized membrane protein